MTTKNRCQTCGSSFESYCSLCDWFDSESCEGNANYDAFEGIRKWEVTRAEFSALSTADTEPCPAQGDDHQGES